MGPLFFRGASPLEIESMSFGQIRYWHGWHEAMKRAEAKALAAPPKGTNA